MMIATTSSSTSLLQPYDVLQKRRKVCARLCTTSAFDFSRLWQASSFKLWANSFQSSLIMIKGTVSLRAQTQAAATLMTDLLKLGNRRVLWALKPPNRSIPDSSNCQLLKYLVMQALQLDPDCAGEKLGPGFNAALMASAVTEHDWIKILRMLLSGYPCAYIIIDVEILGSSARDKLEMEDLVRLLQANVIQNSRTVVKIALVSYRRALSPNLDCLSGTHAVSLDALMHSDMRPSTNIRSYRAEMRQRSALAFKRRVSQGSQTESTRHILVGNG